MASVYKIGTSLATAIDVADVRIRFQNMAPDEATVTLNRNVVTNTALLPSPLNVFGLTNYVAIYRDNVSIFWGYVQNPEQLWSPTSEQVVITLENVWGMWERSMHVVARLFANDASTQYYTTVDDQRSATAISTLVQNFMQGYASPNTAFQIGTFSLPSLNVIVPLSNVSIAEAIRSALKQVVGAMVTFDYSFNPPKVNVFWPGSPSFAEFQTWQRSPAQCEFRWKDRHDLQVPEVRLQYVYPWNITGVNYPAAFNPPSLNQGSSQQSTLWLAGHDSTSPTPGPQRLMQTITLSGTKNLTRHTYSHPSYAGRNSLGYYLYKPGGTPLHPRLVELAPAGYQAQYLGIFVAGKWSTSWTGTATQVSPKADNNPLTVDANGQPTLGFNYFIIPDGMTPPAEAMRANDLATGVEVWDVEIVARFYRTDIGLEVSTVIKLRVQHQSGTYSPGGTHANPVVRDIYSDSPLEAVPTGIASAIKTAAATLTQQGTVEMTDEDALIPGPFQRKVTSPTGTTGVIQTFEIALATGRTSLTVGPPAHRTPDDWRSLYKLVDDSSR